MQEDVTPEATYTIRPARLEEADEVAALWAIMAAEHKAYDEDFWSWKAEAAEIWRERFKELVGQPNMVTLVAEAAGGELVGCAVATGEAGGTAVFGPKRAAVWDLVVRPEHRGRGLGRRLMEAVFEKLKALGAEDVVLHVALANPGTIRFYEKLAMRPVMYRMYKRL